MNNVLYSLCPAVTLENAHANSIAVRFEDEN